MKKIRFMNYSIEKRLPIFIFSLLFVSLVIFISYAYLTVRNNSLTSGYERLNTLTRQFSSILSLQARNLISVTRQVSNSGEVTRFLRNPDETNRENLNQYSEIRFKYDTLTFAVQLLSPDKKLLYTTNNYFNEFASDSGYAAALDKGAYVGRIRQIQNTVVWPILLSVSEGDHLLGYIVRWREIHSSKKTVAQLASLLGRNANIIVGNNDGSLWTNLTEIIPNPRLQAEHNPESLEYLSYKGERVIANESGIPGTPWVLVIELSKNLVLRDTKSFLKWVVVFGIILLAIGLAVTWVLSRNITRPLNELSLAAVKIAEGSYSSPIELNRNDELGVLADSFNEMNRKVRNSKDELEKKINEVEEKNYLLEKSLKEKEILLKEVHHRVKNNLQIISSLLNLQSGSIENPEIKETFKSSQLRIRSIALIHEKLYKSKNLARINLKEYIDELVAYLLNLYNTSTAMIHTKLQMDEVSAEIGTTITLGLIVSELVTNTIKYAFPDERIGEIVIKLNKLEGENYLLVIKDNGIGIPADLDIENAHSLGLSIVKTLLTQIKGKAEFYRSDGTEIRINFIIPAGQEGENSDNFPFSEDES